MSNVKTETKIQKPKLPKKVFLTMNQIRDKIETLESKIKELPGSENRTKRLRYMREVAFLKKAQVEPEAKVINPEVVKEKKDKDQMRRIAKKIMKKKELERAKKAEHNKKRRLNCLYCHKC